MVRGLSVLFFVLGFGFVYCQDVQKEKIYELIFDELLRDFDASGKNVVFNIDDEYLYPLGRFTVVGLKMDSALVVRDSVLITNLKLRRDETISTIPSYRLIADSFCRHEIDCSKEFAIVQIYAAVDNWVYYYRDLKIRKVNFEGDIYIPVTVHVYEDYKYVEEQVSNYVFKVTIDKGIVKVDKNVLR